MTPRERELDELVTRAFVRFLTVATVALAVFVVAFVIAWIFHIPYPH